MPQLYDRLMTRTTESGTISEALMLTDEVNQGRAPAFTFFSRMFCVMPMDAYREKHRGIRIVHSTFEQFLNIRRMQASTRASASTVHEPLFMHDCTVNVPTETVVKSTMHLFAFDCSNLKFAINKKRRSYTSLYPMLNTVSVVSRPKAPQSKQWKSSHSTLLRNTKIGDEMTHRMSEVSQAFGRLQASVWGCAKLSS
nr:unnamed protein product [Spirometra erinaceieuropaei]